MSKEKKLIDMTLSELVDESLKKGLIPIFEFVDKDTMVDKSVPEPNKDWEILTCFDKYGGDTHEYTPRSDDYTISNCDNDKCKIHSVKRNSDGLVFSVGDEVEYYKDLVEPINNFHINEYDKRMWAECYRDKIRGNLFDCPIAELKKSKPKEEVVVDENGRDALAWWQQLLPEVQKKLRQQYRVWLPHSITTSDIKNVYNSERTLPEPERRVTVKRLQYQGLLAEEGYWNYNLWISCGEIPSEKYEPIKQAIEQVLNDDGKPVFDEKKLRERYEEMFKNPPIYTQEQLNKMMEDAFNAARDNYWDSIKYKTFQDYLSSIKH